MSNQQAGPAITDLGPQSHDWETAVQHMFTTDVKDPFRSWLRESELPGSRDMLTERDKKQDGGIRFLRVICGQSDG